MAHLINFSHWKLAVRNIIKQKRTAFLDVTGLALGFTSVLLISVYVYREFSYDSFHENSKRLFKPEFEIVEAKEQIDIASNLQLTTIESIRENVPGLDAITFLNYSRWDWDNGAWIEYKGNKFNIDRMAFSDKYFASVFSFKVHAGNLASSLDNPNQLVLTQDISDKIFGNKNPVGETVLLNNKPVVVGCVLESLPSNSSLQITGLTSYKSAKYFFGRDITDWSNIPFVLAKEKAEPEQVGQSLSKVLYLSLPEKEREELNPVFKTNLIPIKDLYFSQGTPYDPIRHGNRNTTYVVLIIGIVILFLAIINYNNLLLATSLKRKRDFGIQKILGADLNNDKIQLFIRGSIISVFAFILSVFLINLFLAWFNKLVSYPLKFADFLQAKAIGISLILLSVTILMSGFLPSLLSDRPYSLFPVTKRYSKPRTKGSIWKSLVTFQLFISISLLTAALLISKQVNYGLKKDLGITVKNVVTLPVHKLEDKKAAFTDVISKQVQTVSQCLSTSYINTFNIWGGKLNEPGVNSKDIDYNVVRVNSSFIPTLGLELTEGRNFIEGSKSDLQAFVVNDAFVKYYNISKPQESTINGFPIIGVIKDFNFNSLHYAIEPIALLNSPEKAGLSSIHFSANNRAEIKTYMEFLQSEWTQLRPDVPFEYEFLDERLKNMYESDIKLAKIIISFALLSVCIACLGIFGILSYIMESRTKEIGVRKVNGAKISEILRLINGDLFRWTSIAFVVSIPVSWYAISKWLENFAYKTSMSWWVFALAGLLALGIALLTVSWQSWRAATRNPVEALRYE